MRSVYIHRSISHPCLYWIFFAKPMIQPMIYYHQNREENLKGLPHC